MRRQFQLAEEDEQSLASLGLEWEAIIDGNTKWLIVNGYPIPGRIQPSPGDCGFAHLTFIS